MENNKCCLNGDCDKCKDQKGGMCCGHKCWRKCHLIRIIVIVIAFIVVFCLGAQWGEMKANSRDFRFERGGMMNWLGYKNVTDQQKGVGSVTVDVDKTSTTAQ